MRVFNDLEGLKIAVEIEKRGVEIYRHAQRICTAARARELLARLEADERRHQDEFLALLQGKEEASEYSLEQSAYLSAMAADVVFSGGLVEMGKQTGFDSPEAILRCAIQAEKDSLLFYGAILEESPDPATRAVFSEIIRQERGHLEVLIQMMEEEKK
ncbi:MAG: ferritin family protein [Clostridiales bacterium]|jgi:rubrerythrin|nr:ferritin family protein [Bacillota bacterium]NLL55431.1 ferritin family protein [Clostridiales bacterium]